MGTLATGTSDGPEMKRSNGQQGFTLLELLVVIVVMGVLLSMAAISMPGDRRHDLVRDEARRLKALFSLARNEAQLEGRELGIVINTGGYHFVKLEEEKWQPIKASTPFRARSMPNDMEIDVTPTDSQNTQQDAVKGPVLVFWSSGEVTPFELTVSIRDVAGYTLSGDAIGRFAINGS
ncbi:MAG: type II secretion system minor pseudopilin GspH [Candidatus Sedimenticola sp. 20ELBAFRAG]